jgi:hypothetical protein
VNDPGQLKTRDEAKDRLNQSAEGRLAGRCEVPFFPSKSLMAAKRTSSNLKSAVPGTATRREAKKQDEHSAP